MLLVIDLETDRTHDDHPKAIAERIPARTERCVLPTGDDRPASLADQYHGVIISGSTAHIYESNEAAWLGTAADIVQECLEGGLPLLGICFGHQLINWHLGGTVERDEYRAGFVHFDHRGRGVLADVGPIVPVAHADLVTTPGASMEVCGSTAYNEAFCTVHAEQPCYSVQFHPEFDEDVVTSIPEWSPGEHSFAATTAHRVLTNFVAVCDREAGRASAREQ